ncbi:pilus assembly protein PilS [Neisseria meningitidis]|uniref:Pilus assembly protein PilS n=1 Tax=Neisseria meningitidis TaxID=487 RepID=A0A425B1G2_NEIME|nr:pilus assembly protein PilS [Neisseria meningitidis]MBG8593486.1 pilus assembly protein PilS [Neisseria meningitidis]MBG8603267.1 pilus assembly protein PilS [Neisseria meningitidis]MBG8605208.1 pilus assembly protein PilS [Neisseria meningitidis]MBG8609976.1 pilus assembly protein PilS [Neisseria meningitidis]
MPSFPRRRESRPLGTEIYRVKRFLRFYVLDSRLRGNDGRGSAEEVAHSGG